MAQDGRGATFQVTPGAARFENVSVGGAAYARVNVAGAVVVEAPGRPALPTLTLHAAIPEGMSPRLRVVAEEWEDQAGPPPVPVAQQRFVSDDPATGPVSEFRTEPDPVVYRGGAMYPVDAASLGAGALVGEWWVAPIHVRPVRWDPRAGSYRVLRAMTVRVDFAPATERELVDRPATRPGAQARAWDRVQRGLVKNYEAARAFPWRPRPGTSGALPRGGASRAGARLVANPEWKLSVAQTGWMSVSYSTLASSGFPSNIDIANVRVEERGYDDVADTATVTPIPVVARDNNTNGKFDAGDAVTFYARSIRDRFGLGNIELRYSDVNVYWLTWGTTPAPTPGTVSGNIPGAATTPSSFRDVIRLEEDHFAYLSPNNSLTSPPEAIDYLFWTDGFDPDRFSTPIPFQDPDPSQAFRIRSRYQGRLGSIHRLDIFFDGSSGTTDTLTLDTEFFDQEVYLLDTGFTIPGSHIGSGITRYRHFGEQRAFGGPLVEGSRSYLDVIEVTYSRLYKAVNNSLRFTSGGAGGVFEIHVGGFTSPGIVVYDVTDPQAALGVQQVSINPAGGGTFEAVFRTDASSGERRFVALTPGNETVLSGTSVVADTPSNLRSPGAFGASNTARSIIISPSEFVIQASRLAVYRRSQGYVVEVATVEDIYDEFNGGLKSAHAVRRYLRHAYLSWTPRLTYAILAGDGSLDYRHHLSMSAPDWVPTYLRFEPIRGPQGEELVANDPYYFLNLNAIEPGNGDFVPSIMLSRIPAGQQQELDDYVSKVIQYEVFQPTDSWRGRQLLYSDDEYSTTIFGLSGYCFQPQEYQFLAASQTMADITAQSPGGVDIRSDFFNLKTYTDAVPAPGGCKDANAVRTVLVTDGGYDALMSNITQGGLILNMETHANRYLVSHEQVLCSGNTVFCTGPNDPSRVQNVDKPFYMMVWACHANQFPDGPLSGSSTVDSTDAIGEMWILLPSRGAIATFGSSAYEFLETNYQYNRFVAESFYSTPPAPPPRPGEPPQARWILGEVMLEAEVKNAMTGFFTQQVMNRTQHLFADPMLRMDALPPRVYQVTVAGTTFTDNDTLTTDSPTANSALVADLRDEVGIDSVYLTEQDLTSGAVTAVDTLSYSVTYSDSSRLATLTANVRPRVGNYDLQIRAVDINGRLRIFTLQIRTPIRYLANGVGIVNGVFVESGSTLRAEVTSPIPLTADSLELLLDGVVIPSTKTQLDTPGRLWALTASPGALSTGTHLLQVAIGGRTAGLDQVTFQTTNQFTIRGVAVVDPRMQGTGCGGSIFQYELSAAARKVELLILTVAGRRVASIDMPRQAGFNVYCWDGRDGQAHDAAQGLYFYRLRATDLNGKTVSQDGRMIRAR